MQDKDTATGGNTPTALAEVSVGVAAGAAQAFTSVAHGVIRMRGFGQARLDAARNGVTSAGAEGFGQYADLLTFDSPGMTGQTGW